jgi:hypothetical protein
VLLHNRLVIPNIRLVVQADLAAHPAVWFLPE